MATDVICDSFDDFTAVMLYTILSSGSCKIIAWPAFLFQVEKLLLQNQLFTQDLGFVFGYVLPSGEQYGTIQIFYYQKQLRNVRERHTQVLDNIERIK